MGASRLPPITRPACADVAPRPPYEELLSHIFEHLASELQPATYEPGDVIIREGEPGERFYIIASGRTRATKDGGQLREMGPGDSFGEIALLRQVPRTATVTALSRVEAGILGRAEFLAAVTGSPESVGGGEEVVSTRLQAGVKRRGKVAESPWGC